MHHLGIGRGHTSKRILAITDETTVTVVRLNTGEILSEHTIDPPADCPGNDRCLATAK